MLNWQKKLKEYLSGKDICIVGFGREGQSTLKLLKKSLPGKKISIADASKNKNYLQSLNKYNLIIRSPGIPYKLIKKHVTGKTVITSQTKLFFDLCPAKIIGVTGTKGKSTTASLITEVLKQKFKAQLVGNIGRPPLDYLDKLKSDSLAVFEISSHQLSDLEKSPDVAVTMNLFPEHMDYYDSINEYASAKARITKFQKKTDLLIYNLADKRIKKIAQKSRAKKIGFSLEAKTKADCYLDDKFVYFNKLPIFPIEKSPLIGKFNLANIMPAIIIGKHFRISNELIVKGILRFKPLPHRLEFAGKHQGITFINDSLATAPNATINAIKAFKESLGTLIVGGFNRGLSQKDLAQTIIEARIPAVIVFPETGDEIAQIIKKKIKVFRATSMKQAVKLAKAYTGKGKVCLMSPGAASFNMFRDYQDRGDQFKAAVKKL